MVKIIDKIVQQSYTPEYTNVVWDDGEELKINRLGKWESVIKNYATEEFVTQTINNNIIENLNTEV